MNSVEESIAKINMYQDIAEEEKRIKCMEDMLRREKLYKKIRSLTNDIHDVYNTAIVCDKNGILVHDGRGVYFLDCRYEGRRHGEFICQEQKCSFFGETHDIKGLCLWNGGGYYSSEYSLAVIPYVDEMGNRKINLYGYKEEESCFVDVDNVKECWLRYFVDTFETFKNDFYNYVDKIVN